jgi:hypothetical protein
MIPSRFKNAMKPAVGESWVTLYSAPADMASLILQINGAIAGTASLIGSARVLDSSTGTYSYLIKNAPIPQGDAIRLIDQAKIVLEANDVLEVKCESPDETIDYIGSLIEDVNDDSIGIKLGTYKNSILSDVGNEWSVLYETPADMTTFVLQINAANISESGVQVSVRLFDSSEGVHVTVLEGAQVPIADAIRLIDHSKIVLEGGDKLEVKCSTPGEAVDLVASIIEDVNREE